MWFSARDLYSAGQTGKHIFGKKGGGRASVNSESEHPSPGLTRAVAVRVLVVEDFPAFRQFICQALGKRPDLQVIGESADGSEAVQKATELRPDLILMDIGLPSLT